MNMDERKRQANEAGVWRKAGPLFLFAGWLALSATIICVELDRESRYRPGLTAYVPRPFRSFSQAILVKRLLNDGGDAVGTYTEAGTLLLRRPVPAENLSLYGLAAARAGRKQQSLQAIGLAAARGWHDEVSQYAALEASAQAGDWPNGSLHLQALLQVQARTPILSRAVQSFMADPRGRMVLATMIARNPSFQYQILALAGSGGAENMFPPLISALKPFRASVDCGSLYTLVSRWLAHGAAGLAINAWTGLCREGRTGREKDLSFSAHNGEADPFAWHIPDQPIRSWFVEPASGRLSYRNDENFGRLLAWRMLTLAPGAYRLKMEGHPVAINGNYPLLRLKCLPTGQPIEMAPSSDDHSLVTAVVPAGCSAQKLEVKIWKGNFVGLRLSYL